MRNPCALPAEGQGGFVFTHWFPFLFGWKLPLRTWHPVASQPPWEAYACMGRAHFAAPQNYSGGEAKRSRHKLDGVRRCRICSLWLQMKFVGGTPAASATVRIQMSVPSVFLPGSFQRHLLCCWRRRKWYTDRQLRMCIGTATREGNSMVASGIEDAYTFWSRLKNFTSRTLSCRYLCKKRTFVVPVKDWEESYSTRHGVNYCTSLEWHP